MGDEQAFKDLIKSLPGFIGRLTPIFFETQQIEVSLAVDAKTFSSSVEKTKMLGVPGFSGEPAKVNTLELLQALSYKATAATALGFQLTAKRVHDKTGWRDSMIFADLAMLVTCSARMPVDLVLSECCPPVATIDNFMSDVIELVRRHGKGLERGDKNITMMEFQVHD